MLTALRYMLPLTLAGTALALPSVAMADALVVRTSGPSAATYPVGRRLPPSERIVLRAGDRVTIVGEGPSRTLSGPGNFPVRAASASNSGSANTLSRYLNASSASIGRTGAVRARPPAPYARNLWTIDATGGGPRCIVSTDNVMLSRGDMQGAGTLTIATGEATAHNAQLTFTDAQHFQAWPKETLPIQAGTQYRVTSGDAANPNVISFIVLPEAPQNPEAAADALAANGCMAQLADLGEELVTSGNAP